MRTGCGLVLSTEAPDHGKVSHVLFEPQNSIGCKLAPYSTAVLVTGLLAANWVPHEWSLLQTPRTYCYTTMIQCCVWFYDPGLQGYEFGACRFRGDAGSELGAGLFIQSL